MPLIKIRLAGRETPTTAQQKAGLIAGVTELMHKVLAKRRESVVVTIYEVDSENWGEGGEPVTDSVNVTGPGQGQRFNRSPDAGALPA